MGEYDINLEAVHVNQMLRDTAKRDEEFVQGLCRDFSERFKIDLPLHVAKADVGKLSKELGISTEEAGRMVRYDAMNKVLDKRPGSIAVAHHADDRAETVLFNLFRGSSIKGLTGIRAVNGSVIRPLIDILTPALSNPDATIPASESIPNARISCKEDSNYHK